MTTLEDHISQLNEILTDLESLNGKTPWEQQLIDDIRDEILGLNNEKTI